MKILFISKGDLPDYQSDMVLHGGRSTLGADFIDSSRPWYMYKNEQHQWNQRIPGGGSQFGRGFTTPGTLDDIVVDRTDIEAKIKSHYFDFVIYGSVTRCFDHLMLVNANYSREEVIFIDGEDDQTIRTELLNFGRMFKRELEYPMQTGVHPINFAIPLEKVIGSVPTKIQDWATVVPGKLDTYIFFDEKSYYEDYQKSRFAITHKKGGWDCLRHYEILANGCVPYFPDILECPPWTMTSFPKETVAKAKSMIESGTVDLSQYDELANKLLSWTRARLTTTRLFDQIENILNFEEPKL